MTTSILVIEDNRANMKLATLLLSREGYEVLQADSAAAGLALARERRPALILMDIQLPGMDGLEATRIIKADPATRGIKVVALTAFAMAGDEVRIRAAGCDGYMAKPIDYRQFIVEVRHWLASGEMRS